MLATFVLAALSLASAGDADRAGAGEPAAEVRFALIDTIRQPYWTERLFRVSTKQPAGGSDRVIGTLSIHCIDGEISGAHYSETVPVRESPSAGEASKLRPTSERRGNPAPASMAEAVARRVDSKLCT